tara:strand:+ start:236 stop:355 length:120 start_codon:yes stop_codon:yes gene_type:complete
MQWLNQKVLHVAATDILSYFEMLRKFLEHQQFLIRTRKA